MPLVHQRDPDVGPHTLGPQQPDHGRSGENVLEVRGEVAPALPEGVEVCGQVFDEIDPALPEGVEVGRSDRIERPSGPGRVSFIDPAYGGGGQEFPRLVVEQENAASSAGDHPRQVLQGGLADLLVRPGRLDGLVDDVQVLQPTGVPLQGLLG